jgi:hypothetical protein
MYKQKYKIYSNKNKNKKTWSTGLKQTIQMTKSPLMRLSADDQKGLNFSKASFLVPLDEKFRDCLFSYLDQKLHVKIKFSVQMILIDSVLNEPAIHQSSMDRPCDELTRDGLPRIVVHSK